MYPRPLLKIAAALLLGTLVMTATTSVADAQPPEAVFQQNDQTWLCHEDGFPAPSHCENINSQGATGLIMVFPPDDRGPAEGVSDARADDRPCPHDPGSPDGTWWEVVPGTFVCHHRP